ncbi:hypothetical protein HDU97_001117 [Phlyctochytrium planicorne]|nr:hypothetical protein HDU97_001117 [Phlyctochytrium planicorne]
MSAASSTSILLLEDELNNLDDDDLIFGSNFPSTASMSNPQANSNNNFLSSIHEEYEPTNSSFNISDSILVSSINRKPIQRTSRHREPSISSFEEELANLSLQESSHPFQSDLGDRSPYQPTSSSINPLRPSHQHYQQQHPLERRDGPDGGFERSHSPDPDSSLSSIEFDDNVFPQQTFDTDIDNSILLEGAHIRRHPNGASPEALSPAPSNSAITPAHGFTLHPSNVFVDPPFKTPTPFHPQMPPTRNTSSKTLQEEADRESPKNEGEQPEGDGKATPSRGVVGNNANFHDMLVEVINECQDLRKANELLQETVDGLKADLYLKENCIRELEAASRGHIDTISEIDNNRRSELENLRCQLVQQSQEIQMLRSENVQISAIRETLSKEKELDILTYKKELMKMKEAEIQDLRRDLLQHRDDAVETERAELRNMVRDLEGLNERLMAEMHEMRSDREREREYNGKKWRDDGKAVSIQCEIGDEQFERRIREMGRSHNDILEDIGKIINVDGLSQDPIGVMEKVAIEWRGTVDGLEGEIGEKEREIGRLSERVRELELVTQVQPGKILSASASPFRRSTGMRSLSHSTLGDSAHAILSSKTSGTTIGSGFETKTAIESLEAQHRQNLEHLRTSHEAELASLRSTYTLQLNLLQTEVSTLRNRLAPLPPLTASLPDLQRSYPSQFKEFENQLNQNFRRHQGKLFETHGEEVKRLKEDFERERKELNERYHDEVRGTVEMVKGRCFEAYEGAVRKLKMDFVALREQYVGKASGQCDGRCAGKEWEREKAVVVSKYEAALADLRRGLTELEKKRAADIEVERARHSNEISRIKTEYQAYYTKQLREALEKMKRRYVTLLQETRKYCVVAIID